MEKSKLDGEIVGEIPVSQVSDRGLGFEKGFKAFLAQQGFPDVQIVRTKSFDRLTGYTATIERPGKTITFMTIEPKDNPQGIVLVMRSEKEKAGTIMDIIDYRCRGKNPTPSPFAGLEGLKLRLEASSPN